MSFPKLITVLIFIVSTLNYTVVKQGRRIFGNTVSPFLRQWFIRLLRKSDSLSPTSQQIYILLLRNYKVQFFLKNYLFIIFLFACTVQHVESQFPDQGLNLGPGQWSSNRQTAREFSQSSVLLGASLVAQMVKNLPSMQTKVRSLGWEYLFEKEMATHSSILAWKNLMDRGAWQGSMGLQNRGTLLISK